ncbi:MAG: flagellar protein FlaG [Pseudomonadota bacterium]
MTIDSISATGSARHAEPAFAGLDTAALHSVARPAAIALETAGAVKGAGPAPTLEQVQHAVSELNKSSQAKSQGLEFSVDNDSKRTIVKVIDQTTKEVLRQIPSPEALEIAKSLDNTKGLLIRQTA